MLVVSLFAVVVCSLVFCSTGEIFCSRGVVFGSEGVVLLYLQVGLQ